MRIANSGMQVQPFGPEVSVSEIRNPKFSFGPSVRGLFSLVEAVALIGAAPFLIFPNRYSPYALGALPVLWLARLLLHRRTLRRTPADWPLLGLLVMTSVSLYPSVDLTLSQPKLYGLILGLALCAFLVQRMQTSFWQRSVAVLLVLGGVGLALVGLVGTQWNEGKLPFLAPLYDLLPQPVIRGPWAAKGGFNPNVVGGMLALLFPFALALALFSQRWWVGLLLGIPAAVMLGTLVLTVSRSALAGTAVAVMLLALLRWRRLAVLSLPVASLGVMGMVWWYGPEPATRWLFTAGTAADRSLQWRAEVWYLAYLMVQDFPFTGIGLDTFSVVANDLYPLFIPQSIERIPHAHNLVLQTAVDLGLPGLLSFLGLIVAAGISLARSWPGAAGWRQGLVAGLAAGLLGHLVFGLTDAVALGTRPGFFLWTMLAAAVAVGSGDRTDHSTGAGPLQWAQWALFTLACGLGTAL